MELNCPSCGSICDIVFEEDQTTESHPLFCPFCGENVDEIYEEDNGEPEENEDYLDRLLEHELGVSDSFDE